MNDPVDFNHLKQAISLPEYAASCGYELDKRKSTKNSLVMSQRNNDKIVISKPGEVWVYFSVYDESDNGTIIDFVKNRSDKSLYEVGKELEQWLGIASNKPMQYASLLKKSRYDPARIGRLFRYCQPVMAHPYLEKRGITSDIVKSQRFYSRILKDQFGNVVFPHLSKGNICGLELVNDQTHLFVRGSEKTLWRSNHFLNDDTLIISETPIDAISYQMLHCLMTAFYTATCGGFSAKQADIIRKIISELAWIKEVILITDNDPGGDQITRRLEKLIDQTSFSGSVKRHSPKKRGCDWNDVLTQIGI